MAMPTPRAQPLTTPILRSHPPTGPLPTGVERTPRPTPSTTTTTTTTARHYHHVRVNNNNPAGPDPHHHRDGGGGQLNPTRPHPQQTIRGAPTAGRSAPRANSGVSVSRSGSISAAIAEALDAMDVDGGTPGAGPSATRFRRRAVVNDPSAVAQPQVPAQRPSQITRRISTTLAPAPPRPNSFGMTTNPTGLGGVSTEASNVRSLVERVRRLEHATRQLRGEQQSELGFRSGAMPSGGSGGPDIVQGEGSGSGQSRSRDSPPLPPPDEDIVMG